MILGDSIKRRMQGRTLGRKDKQSVIVRSFPGAKLNCMSHYVIPANQSNLDRTIIHCGRNNLKWASLQRQLLNRLLSWKRAPNQPQKW